MPTFLGRGGSVVRAVTRCLCAAALLGAVPALWAAGLELVKTIPLPHVDGRIDHFAMDPKGNRLFVAALGNNTVEVVDLTSDTVARSIPGFSEPQGLLFRPELNRLYVANGGDGTVRVLDGDSFQALGNVQLDADSDNLRYDFVRNRIFVGHGRGALSEIDPKTNAVLGSIALGAHPEAFQLEAAGPRIFVNLPGSRQVAVVDRVTRTVLARWSIGFAAANFPMALDEASHRLVIGCRLPARLLTFDTQTGRELSKSALHGDCDDLFWDPERGRLYASCGEGFIDVFTPTTTGGFDLSEAVQTEPKARTCFVDRDRIYLAVPKRGAKPAEIRIYHAVE